MSCRLRVSYALKSKITSKLCGEKPWVQSLHYKYEEMQVRQSQFTVSKSSVVFTVPCHAFYRWDKEVDDFLVVSIELSIWMQAAAEAGVFYYFGSILLTQALGAAAVALGRAYGCGALSDGRASQPAPVARLLSTWYLQTGALLALIALIVPIFIHESLRKAYSIDFEFHGKTNCNRHGKPPVHI